MWFYLKTIFHTPVCDRCSFMNTHVRMLNKGSLGAHTLKATDLLVFHRTSLLIKFRQNLGYFLKKIWSVLCIRFRGNIDFNEFCN